MVIFFHLDLGDRYVKKQLPKSRASASILKLLHQALSIHIARLASPVLWMNGAGKIKNLSIQLIRQALALFERIPHRGQLLWAHSTK